MLFFFSYYYQGCFLCFWNIYAGRPLVAYFHAAASDDDSILALAAGNSILAAADTSGFLSLWNIKHFALGHVGTFLASVCCCCCCGGGGWGVMPGVF